MLPTVCLVGWIIGHPFTLDLDPLSVIILTLSVIHACVPPPISRLPAFIIFFFGNASVTADG